ncbi:hypothetical protein QLX08_001157 [Tetragonisca angustula]|uniref:Uncharacterized protein n=1 Tax=Tetragonisca angustula TaxID=166442 RepID=A0AAW1AGC5_9HYME
MATAGEEKGKRRVKGRNTRRGTEARRGTVPEREDRRVTQGGCGACLSSSDGADTLVTGFNPRVDVQHDSFRHFQVFKSVGNVRRRSRTLIQRIVRLLKSIFEYFSSEDDNSDSGRLRR